MRILFSALSTLLLLSPPTSAGGFFDLTGTWQGEARFHFRKGADHVAGAHTVTAVVLTIEPGGQITGASEKSGCQIAGLATPGALGLILNMDFTLSKCAYPGYNARYLGTLRYLPKQGIGVLSMKMSRVVDGEAPDSAEVKATLRR